MNDTQRETAAKEYETFGRCNRRYPTPRTLANYLRRQDQQLAEEIGQLTPEQLHTLLHAQNQQQN